MLLFQELKSQMTMDIVLTVYTTQHSHYYKLYYFTSYISLCSLTLQDYWIYIWMHLWKYLLLALYHVHNLSSPR